jgi:hypothetical protein
VHDKAKAHPKEVAVGMVTMGLIDDDVTAQNPAMKVREVFRMFGDIALERVGALQPMKRDLKRALHASDVLAAPRAESAL